MNKNLLEEANYLRRRVAELERQQQRESDVTATATDNAAVGQHPERNWLTRIYREAPVGLCCFDTQLRYLDINEWLAALNGLSVEEHLGRSVSELFPELAAGIESQLRHVIETGEPILEGSVFAETPAQPNVKRHFHHNYEAVKSDDGTVVGVSCSIIEITEQKRAEEAMKQANDNLETRVTQRTAELEATNERLRFAVSDRLKTEQALADREELYHRAIDTADAVAYQYDFESNSYIHMDDGIERLIGYTAAEVTPAIWDAIAQQRIYCGEAKGLSKVEADQKYRAGDLHLWKAEYLCVLADGREVWLADSSVPVRNGEGRVTGCLGILQDITERKLSEETLRSSEEQSRSLLEQSPDGVGVVVNGRFVFTNTRLGELTGYDHDAMVGCPPTDFLVTADHERALCCMGDVMASKPTVPLDVLFSRKNGGTVPVEVLSRSIQYRGSSALLCVIREVTERKQAEAALRESEAKSRTLLEGSPVCIKIVDLDSRLQYMSAAGREQLKISDIEPFYGCTFPSDLYPQPWQRLATEHLERAKSGESSSVECSVLDTEGNELWYDTTFVPARDQEGKVVHVVVTSVNITERKQAGEALRRSEAEFRLLANNVPALFSFIGADGCFRFVNRRYEEWFGMPAAKIVGKHYSEILENSVDGTIKDYIEVALSGERVEYEVELPNRHNGTGWFNAVYVPDKVDGKVRGFFALLTDISDRKLAEQVSHEKQAQLDNLLSNVDAIILEGDPYSFYYVGGQVEKLLGYPKEMWFEHPEGPVGFWSGLLHPDDLDKIDTCMQAIKQGEDHSFEYRMIAKDGKTVWFYDSVMVETRDGIPIKTRSVMIDITAQKQTEEEIRQLQENLAHVVRLSTMGEMATGIAHELNQPLAGIATYCYAGQQLLAKTGSTDPEQLRELFEKSAVQAMRGGEIIRRLRNLVSKTDSARVSIDIGELIGDVFRLLETDLRQSQARIERQLNHLIPTVMIDEVQIQQVLVNLIRNAIDAMSETERDQRTLKISTSQTSDDLIEVAVSDTGKGIPVESADQVFEAFFSSKSEGMGMGLAISRTIIESHGCRLWMTPNPDRGVTFHFTLPAEKDESTDDGN